MILNLYASPSVLSGLYQKLLQFATLTFRPKHILGFLGRKWDRHFAGDAQTEIKTDRVLGRNSVGFNPAVRTFACCA